MGGISKNPSEGGDKFQDKLGEILRESITTLTTMLCVNTFEVHFSITLFFLDQYFLLRDSTPPIP